MKARIIRRVLPAVLTVGVLGIAAPTASAGETLAANCEPPRDFASSGWDYAAQSFTPQLSGPLTRAEVDISKNAPTEDYVLEIRTVDGSGIPTDTVLASATVANASVPVGDSLISASFPNPTTVASGQEYALVVYLGADPTGGVGYHIDAPCSGYVAFSDVAEPWEGFVGFDMVFRVFVTTPDPPATAPTAPAAPKKKCKKKKKKPKRAAESAKKKKCKKKKK
jgi:hypothetical protein